MVLLDMPSTSRWENSFRSARSSSVTSRYKLMDVRGDPGGSELPPNHPRERPMASIARRSFSGGLMSSWAEQVEAARRHGSTIARVDRTTIDPRHPHGQFLCLSPQYRLFRRLHLVGPADLQRVRSLLQECRVLLDDLQQHIRERVERLLALRLGRLHHQGLGNDQREVHGWRVEAEVQESLRDVHGAD